MYSNIQRSGVAFVSLSWGFMYHLLATLSIFFAILAVGMIIRCIWSEKHQDPNWQ